ncbi:MAG: hypothetical protein K2X27_17675 [Candidatus Obscuribacterales bacterium]|nr:hypothetical protein [Candidatus Obscuribacterales bacterium]
MTPSFQPRLKQPVLCLTALLVLLLNSSPASAANTANASRKLSEIETAIVGNSNPKLPIEQRIRQLELKVFAKVQSGSLRSRIEKLETFAGLDIQDSMPPKPPAFQKQSQTKAENKNPEELKQQLEEAVKLHHSGKEFEAEQSLRRILSSNPGNADAFFSLGAIAETRGDLQTALDYYTQAMQANPNDSEAQSAVAELSRKITALKSGPFVNPLGPVSSPAPNVLQGRAWDLTVNNGAYNGMKPITAPSIPTAAIGGSGQIPTVGVTQANPNAARNRAIGRTLARAALGAALSGTGLHCPMCHLLRGF